MRAEWTGLGYKAGPSIVASIVEPEYFAAAAPNAQQPAIGITQRLQNLANQLTSLKNVKNLDTITAQTTPAELAIQYQKLNEYYRNLLASAGGTYRDQTRGDFALPVSLQTADIRTWVTR